MEGGRDHLSVLAYAQRVQKERRAINESAILRGQKPPHPPEEGVPLKPYLLRDPLASTRAPPATVYDWVYAGSPRGALVTNGFMNKAFATDGFASPRLAPLPSQTLTSPGRPHMQHHFGYGWGDGPSTSFRPGGKVLADSTDRAWELHGDHTQHAAGLAPTKRAAETAATWNDSVAPNALRKPSEHPDIKPHQAHFLSWPGQCLYVPRTKHFFKPQVSSYKEVRGEKPLTAQMLISAGSRPPFPYFATTAKEALR